MTSTIVSLTKKAHESAVALSSVPAETRNKTLRLMAKALVQNRTAILRANSKDIDASRHKGLSRALIDRLTLTEERIRQMADSLNQIACLKDVVGEQIRSWRRPNGLLISKVRVPIGVIAIIYESRPNVTADCIGLCLKSANVVILRGGSEALHSNRAIYNVLAAVARKTGIPDGALNFVATADRAAVDVLLKQVQYIDLVIPRGGEGLIRMVNEKSRIPVIKHYKGVCHMYVDRDADLKMAEEVVFNAKVQRPGVCNAAETLLVHQAVARRFLPSMIKRLMQAGVEIRGCAQTRKIFPGIKSAKEIDWYTEYLDLILSVKVVGSITEAVDHIATYGTRHSDAIITRNRKTAEAFLWKVDSACVYVNASTRFTDGGEFGLGAEIGISTDKIHARGPMGIEELTTYKYIVRGTGQIRR